MTITSGGWFDWSTREPGPTDRQAFYSANILIKAIFHHSMEGYRGSYSALTDPARKPTGWCGTVAFDGTLYQHYPVQAKLVASHAGNDFGPAFELEGVQSQPINAAQLATWKRIHKDIADYTRRAPIRKAGTINLNAIPANELWLLEHRQVGPTACPSERYAPLWAALAGEPQEDDMALLDEVVAALGGIEAIREWNQKGNSLLLGYAQEQQWQGEIAQALGDHINNHPVGPSLPKGARLSVEVI